MTPRRRIKCIICKERFVTGRRNQKCCANPECRRERNIRNFYKWQSKRGNHERKKAYCQEYYRQTLGADRCKKT